MSTAIEAEELFTLQVHIGSIRDFGATPFGGRRLAVVNGGSFEGARLRGAVESGTDWVRVRADGARQLDVRHCLKTDDGYAFAMYYTGHRLASPEIMERDKGGTDTEGADYWYRISGSFEGGPGRYEWLNRVLFVGLGTRRPPAHPVFRIFAVR